MNQIPTESLQQPVEAARPTGIARRRLLRAGLAAAPVVLAVSGRSAMAQVIECPNGGLSPLAWASIRPDGVCVASSHSHTSSALGVSPGNLRPNEGKRVFNHDWPRANGVYPGVKPFESISFTESNGNSRSGSGKLVTYTWQYGNPTYYEKIPRDAAGWSTGTAFNAVFGGAESRSFSRILIDESGNSNTVAPASLVWFFCAAYINAMTVPGYAMRPQEVLDAYQLRKLGGRTNISDQEMIAFLNQTWS